jgi:hypothetical protein
MLYKEGSTTSALLEEVVRNCTTDLITLEELKAVMHERGFGLLMVIFSFPTAIPLPYPPGFTILTGLPLVMFSIQMLLGMDAPWLPKWLGKKTVKRETLARMIEISAPFFRKIELFSKPRLSFTSHLWGERLVGVWCLLCALSVALPIPLGNAVPSAGILLMALGLLNRDGILVIIGMVVGVIGLFVSAAVVLLGVEVVTRFILPALHWMIGH